MPPGHRLTDLVQRAGAALGLHVTRIDNTLPFKRQHLLEQQRVDVVLDVGANVGGYVAELRRNGYGGRIVSFEPIAAAHAALERRCAADARWRGLHTALGDSDGRAEIGVSQNVVSSSLRAVTARSVRAAGATATMRTESIAVARLDTLRNSLLASGERAFLKIDVQGFEREVLAGARDTLAQVVGLELELSLVELYAGQALLPEMMALAAGLGFWPVWLERGFKDPTSGHLLQMDGLFLAQHAAA
jgi:FkbM family methyltransferase